MKDWTKALIGPHAPIRAAIQTIDESGIQIALVVDESGQLVGTVTDGDVRRGILKGISLDASVEEVMNAHPVTSHATEDREAIFRKMRLKHVRHVPVLDAHARVVGMEFAEDLLYPLGKENWVVLMAGGLGTRLRPLTDDYPKPLLRVGQKPLLEIILENFIQNGFRNFYISVNYKADLIRDYFGDGSHWNVEIRYLHEDKRLGTAGALSLIPDRASDPLLVMNGDLLTKVDFQKLLDFHVECAADATMCVREYLMRVPYGVVNIDGRRIVEIEEKPTQRFLVNAGMYVLSPSVLDLIPQDTFLDMPTLLSDIVGKKFETAVYPVREYWLDVGRMDDFERAQAEVSAVFEDD